MPAAGNGLNLASFKLPSLPDLCVLDEVVKNVIHRDHLIKYTVYLYSIFYFAKDAINV